MLSYPSGLHPRGLGHLFLRGPGFISQSAQLSRKIPCDIAVFSVPQAMPPQHLWDPKQRVDISRSHYKRESARVGSFPMIVRYLLTIFAYICSYCELLNVDTLSIVFPMTATLHVVDLILNFVFFHCRYLGVLVHYFLSSKHWYLENLSYSKKQQEQGEAQTKQHHQSLNSGSLF